MYESIDGIGLAVTIVEMSPDVMIELSVMTLGKGLIGSWLATIVAWVQGLIHLFGMP